MSSKNVVNLVETKVTAREMCKDLYKLVKIQLDNGNTNMRDMMVIYRTADNDFAWLGQTVRAVDTVEVIGLMEIVKMSLYEVLYHSEAIGEE